MKVEFEVLNVLTGYISSFRYEMEEVEVMLQFPLWKEGKADFYTSMIPNIRGRVISCYGEGKYTVYEFDNRPEVDEMVNWWLWRDYREAGKLTADMDVSNIRMYNLSTKYDGSFGTTLNGYQHLVYMSMDDFIASIGSGVISQEGNFVILTSKYGKYVYEIIRRTSPSHLN